MNGKENNDTKDFPRPSEAMRAMRPHLFSDAQPDSAPRLSKTLLEYQLDTLTSRKQEYEFEHFCRKLAEKEICPNLRTQTGPTGGGDSKVDTETYPVADEVAERWWIGEPGSGADRWAFAFSSKKKWKEKCAGDVAKVMATGRGYKRIYFFTNQFVSDRVRASLEDQLTTKYEVPVHIMDRAWIVEKVLANGHALLAISALAIEGISSGASRAGPLDTARLAELEELESQIADPSRYTNARFQLVEDCLEVALLARGLERPRAEVEGRFDRAARLAQGSGKQQRMRVAYYQAWTAYWWYDDFGEFGKFYDQVEATVDGTTLAADTQRLVNLWQLLLPAVASNRLSRDEAKVDARRVRLEAILASMADDEVRPNNAIQARSQLTMIEVTSALHASDKGRLEDCWIKLGEIADEACRLPAYPIESLSDMLRMLGKVMDSAGFDRLYEKIVEIVRSRRSEGEAGEAYRLRGIQKLEQEKPYEAIQWFGRAEELLLKEEYAEELVLVLAGSSIAYERVGLLWAARQKILAAAERCSQAFFEDGRIGLAMARSFNRLVWLELQLGRIPHALSAMELASAIAKHLKLSDEEREACSKEIEHQESALMIHILRMSKEQLQAVPELADVFERIGLTNARLALLFALGQRETIQAEYCAERGNLEEFDSWLPLLLDQPMAKDIALVPVLVVGSTSLLQSRILGAELNVRVANHFDSFGVAESLLAGMEALLATSRFGDVIPRKEVTSIEIGFSNSHSGVPLIRSAKMVEAL
jgi:tetratricopeptide (TPR) repeat protein